MSEKQENAMAYMDASFNCAQSVFAPFAEDYDIDAETALRVAGSFGGGMRCGEVCGAVSGGLMVVGCKTAQYLPNDTGAKQISGDKTIEFENAFREKHECLLCRELLGFNPTTPEGQERMASDGVSKQKCRGFVSDAVGILEELGY